MYLRSLHWRRTVLKGTLSSVTGSREEGTSKRSRKYDFQGHTHVTTRSPRNKGFQETDHGQATDQGGQRRHGQGAIGLDRRTEQGTLEGPRLQETVRRTDTEE